MSINICAWCKVRLEVEEVGMEYVEVIATKGRGLLLTGNGYTEPSGAYICNDCMSELEEL